MCWLHNIVVAIIRLRSLHPPKQHHSHNNNDQNHNIFTTTTTQIKLQHFCTHNHDCIDDIVKITTFPCLTCNSHTSTFYATHRYSCINDDMVTLNPKFSLLIFCASWYLGVMYTYCHTNNNMIMIIPWSKLHLCKTRTGDYSLYNLKYKIIEFWHMAWANLITEGIN